MVHPNQEMEDLDLEVSFKLLKSGPVSFHIVKPDWGGIIVTEHYVVLVVSVFTDICDDLQIVEAEVVMVATEAVASEVVEVSAGEIVEAMEEVEDLEAATKWEEGWYLLMWYFLYDHKVASLSRTTDSEFRPVVFFPK